MGAVKDSMKVKKAGPRPASRELRSDIMDYHSEATVNFRCIEKNLRQVSPLPCEMAVDLGTPISLIWSSLISRPDQGRQPTDGGGPLSRCAYTKGGEGLGAYKTKFVVTYFPLPHHPRTDH
jgi:hypothetical protein